MQALEFVPTQYGLLIWDVYRPRAVQEKLFNWMRAEVKKKYPNLTDEENYLESKKYAAPSSKIKDAHCPPHLSGGSIDLTLYDLKTDKEADMGTVFDDCTTRAHRDFFETKNDLSKEEVLIKASRNLLRSAMEKVGFTSYQYEWWHFDIGNILWSDITGNPAVFGPLFGDEEWPNNIIKNKS
jgi:D-alanyl-D-alanine dipeptidase